MIAEWDVPVTRPESGEATQVMLVVPLPQELGGAGEVLVLSAFGNLKLPSGTIQPRETSLKAAARIALAVAGIAVSVDRLVYVIEQPGMPLALCVQCELSPDSDNEDAKYGVKFADLSTSEGSFEPSAVRELLIEDVRSGFARGVAHIVVSYDAEGREQTTVSW